MSERMPDKNVRKYMPYILPDEMSETMTKCRGGDRSKENKFGGKILNLGIQFHSIPVWLGVPITSGNHGPLPKTRYRPEKR
jgi:hypothetical protein